LIFSACRVDVPGDEQYQLDVRRHTLSKHHAYCHCHHHRSHRCARDVDDDVSRRITSEHISPPAHIY
jgi:hypothetical protein